MNLVIVESPAKARTISKLLGSKYRVKASMGHLIDLPKSQLGIDIENNFKPKYITVRGKGKTLKELKEMGKKADRVFLATDPDREGEAISWHLSNALELGEDTPCRVEFNEITKAAVKDAFKSPQPVDMKKIEAQQARRILDRLVGYKISPLLWKKVRRGLSAGRVQSVAVKLICDREEEINAFVPEEYWSIEAELKTPREELFTARFHGKNGEKLTLRSKGEVDEILEDLQKTSFVISNVEVKDRKRNPSPPFITSTLQQEAYRKLGFTTRKTMSVAQQLYEGVEIGKKKESVGLITYMRTDSTRISPVAQEEARTLIAEKYGSEYMPQKPRNFKSKKGAQEAHEAIRPTSAQREPGSMKSFLSRDQYRLYKLIWERFMASQMAAAVLEQVRVDIGAGEYWFRANGSTIKFPGFMAIYIESKDDDKEEDKEGLLPPLEKAQLLELSSLSSDQHFTQPPPRYTEATLVKTMEEKGIGRPSTYSPTIETIQSRGYVLREDKALKPNKLGYVVVDLLKYYFPETVDVSFTAQMEDQLDRVESGDLSRYQVLKEFYEPFEKRLRVAEKEMEKVELEEEVTEEVCPQCGKNLIKKIGRYGHFLACPGFPECRYTMQPRVSTGVSCPLCEGEIVERKNKKGRKFYGCSNYPDCKFVSSSKPLQQKCPECGYFLVEKKSKGGPSELRCGSKECSYVAPVELVKTGSGSGKKEDR